MEYILSIRLLPIYLDSFQRFFLIVPPSLFLKENVVCVEP